MPAGESLSATGPAVTLESQSTLRIDCYVRASLPPVVSDTVTDIVQRVERLCELGRVDDYRVERWPPECHAVDATGDATTRDELVAEFERWASDSGHSLEPAFRRREINLSPLGIDADGPRERVRVPLVALAIREDDGGDADGLDDVPDAASLCGVVPYTERSPVGEERIYTVDEWLSAVEPTERTRSAGLGGDGRPTRLEGQQ